MELILCTGQPDTRQTENRSDIKKTAVILDTDVGTDDAAAFLAAEYLPDIHIDYIIASKGNTTLAGAVRNAIILKSYLNSDAVIVRGRMPDADKNVDEKEKNTFHGNDGLANISAEMINKLGLTDEQLNDYIGYENYLSEILRYDKIVYIAIGPTTNLANALNASEFRDRISKIFIMGGGINEFNCGHDTEFNFSRDPQSVKKIIESGADITLFTLDLTNHQRIDEEQINALEACGTYGDYIAMLRFNKQANAEYNKIDAAVIHDAMPVLYLEYPEKFSVTDMKITIDRYGATKAVENGKTVHVVLSVEENLLYKTLSCIFGGKKQH